MKRVLITGASGFIGGHLSLQLASAGHQIAAVHHTRALPEEVLEAVEVGFAVDLLDSALMEKKLAEFQPEVIVHAAALTSVNLAEEQPSLAWSVNETGTASLLAACEKLPEKPFFIYLSTDLVFDGSNSSPSSFSELDPPQAATNYSRSKLAGEQAVAGYNGRAAVLRTALTYGPPVGDSSGCMGWLLKGLREQTPVHLFVDEWRTPVFVLDIVETVQALLLAKEASGCRLFHLGGAERISRYDFGLHTADIFGYSDSALVKSKQADIDSKVHRAKDASLCIEKLKETLGVSPRDIRSGLQQMKLMMS